MASERSLDHLQTENVMLVGPNPSLAHRKGGVAAHMKSLAACRIRERFRISEFFTDASWVYRLPLPLLVKNVVSVVSLSIAIIATRKSFVAAHVNSSLYASALVRDVPVVLALRARRIPILIQYHGGRLSNVLMNPLARIIWKSCIRDSVALACCFPGEQLEEFDNAGMNGRHAAVLNFTDVPSSVSIDTGSMVRFLFLGRVVKEKGVHEMLEAFTTIHQSYGDSELHIVGDGPELKVMSDIVNANPALRTAVKFHGQLVGRKKEELLRRCNVLVLASYKEGMPLSALEAAAFGLAIIITPKPGFDHLLMPPDVAHIVPKDAHSLAKAMADVCASTPARVRMGSRARNVVRARCSLDSGSEQFERLYRSIARLQ